MAMRNEQRQKPQRSRRCRCGSCCLESELPKPAIPRNTSSGCTRFVNSKMQCKEKFVFLTAMIMAASATESATSSYVYSATTSTTIGQSKGLVLTEDFCNRNYMQISRLSILCNTPGAYYHGSNAYRNSEVCMSGDKANLEVSFSIPRGLKTAIVYVEIEFGIYDNFQSVFYGSLCQMDVSQNESFLINDEVDDYWGDSSVCPHPGSYDLRTYYSVPSMRDYAFHYTPDIRMTFTNEYKKVIGCVVSGPSALRLSSERRAIQGFLFLGGALLVFLCIFGALLFLSHRRKQRLKMIREKRNHHASGLNYPYLRAAADGQVSAPFRQPEQLPTPRIANHAISEDEDEDSENALNISNPAYNETHMPTRPII